MPWLPGVPGCDSSLFVHVITEWLFDCHETKLQAYLTQHHQLAASTFACNVKDCTIGLLSF
jgi:hypothetical protein